MRNWHFYVMLVWLCAACGPKAPKNDDLKDFCREAAFTMAQAGERANEAFGNYAEAWGKKFDVRKITPEQVEVLFEAGGSVLDARLRGWLAPVLKEKSTRQGKEGALASYLRWKYMPEGENDKELFKRMITNPSMSEVLAENEKMLSGVLSGAAREGGNVWVEYGILEQVVTLLDMMLPEEALWNATRVFDAAFAAEQITPEKKEEIRKKVEKQYIALLGTERYREGRRRTRAEETLRYLQGAYAKGVLIGNVAPELDFLWISGGEENNLKDFKGRILLLDFWATKCAPCVDIIPNMRALAKRYAGYPVEIVGVTSVMGYHVDVKHGKTLSTKGKPEYEFELMQRFMKDMGMTWRVAFSRQNVMNPDYGVKGIPHIAVVDATGNVRYNGLDPFAAPWRKAELIDSLLREAGLCCPAMPMEKSDYSKHKGE